ncbi:diguanylate cyclase (GGDEF) domain-containing protein [Desulfonispora thiosulfatigenes DSM 11270]|uniref:Diguanylate cyclase (GGDEF) domain-containing protein n=1 Tax=Desulfonispora thiosulfatigenes DSM 11270 TaxID=656914 RepID=A0A1W1VAE7_DESTI|nr:diguanylate cyclase [Desulfonispora thiosulfatigenes]SMB90328.1 diguanylate cyclase (GGDEF) domain-containing protein [Desulfonispora thiosulfatigenes DSM 11270]
MKDTDINNIFQKEMMIIENALLEIEENEDLGNISIDKFAKLAKDYHNLLKLSKKVFKISDSQGKELKIKTTDISNILNNSHQGFLTFTNNLKVNKEYSSECLRIFEKRIAGEDITQLLSNGNSQKEKEFKETFTKIFEESVCENRKALLKKLPNIIHLRESIINLNYQLITQVIEGSKDLIMLVLTDITERQKIEDQVVYLSYHDKLTSLYNRVYMESIIPQLESEEAMPLSLIMADMNGLKLTNDVFGHESGDKILVNAAKVLLSSIRKTDYVARWGGDEFLIILPNTDKEKCEQVCEQINLKAKQVEADPIEISLALGSATICNPDTKIFELLNIAENRMYSNKITESKHIRRKIILNMKSTLYTKCFEDPEHFTRMQKMALNFLSFLKFRSDVIDEQIVLDFIELHDIGKIAIPKELLAKNETLKEQEWEIMKNYTEVGFRMAKSIDENFLAGNILALRERWDGLGYPYGLEKNEIPFLARFLSIIEAYDVMTHWRPYKKAISKEKAMEELKINKGKQFDPELVDLFLNNIEDIVS